MSGLVCLILGGTATGRGSLRQALAFCCRPNRLAQCLRLSPTCALHDAVQRCLGLGAKSRGYSISHRHAVDSTTVREFTPDHLRAMESTVPQLGTHTNANLLLASIPYFLPFVHSSTQSLTVLYQRREFFGF